MVERLIKTLSLKNGVVVRLMDASKKIAGDRWFVSLVTRVEIPVNEKTLGLEADRAMDPQLTMEDMTTCLGKAVLFENKMERNFISEDEKEPVLNGFIASAVRLSESYYRHPDFAKKFILRQYKEKKQRQAWYT